MKVTKEQLIEKIRYDIIVKGKTNECKLFGYFMNEIRNAPKRDLQRFIDKTLNGDL